MYTLTRVRDAQETNKGMRIKVLYEQTLYYWHEHCKYEWLTSFSTILRVTLLTSGYTFYNISLKKEKCGKPNESFRPFSILLYLNLFVHTTWARAGAPGKRPWGMRYKNGQASLYWHCHAGLINRLIGIHISIDKSINSANHWTRKNTHSFLSMISLDCYRCYPVKLEI